MVKFLEALIASQVCQNMARYLAVVATNISVRIVANFNNWPNKYIVAALPYRSFFGAKVPLSLFVLSFIIGYKAIDFH